MCAAPAPASARVPAIQLVGRLPVITNVLTGLLPRVPMWRSLTRVFLRAEVRQGLDALAQVGIDDYAFQRASTLSGGQQQRAAIARTLVQNARVILADEPIASLDPESSRRVMDTLAQINRSRKVAVVVSLHQSMSPCATARGWWRCAMARWSTTVPRPS